MNSLYYYRKLQSEHYEYPGHLLGLDYYKKFSAGEDDFSRKQVWFYTYGDEEIRYEFIEEMTNMLNLIVDGGETNWDLLVPIPSRYKGEINKNIENLASDLADHFDFSFADALYRNHTVRSNHELETEREKVINVEKSLEVKQDVEGKNIILIDNISLTGSTFLHAIDLLKKNGANKILCICLGLDYRRREGDLEFNAKTSKEILEKIEG